MPTPVYTRPSTDWTCLEIQDSQAVSMDEISRCEFCSTRIRWIHILQHDQYDRLLQAGCCCASRMCLDYDAEGAERELKNRFSRLMSFSDQRKWYTSESKPENIWRWVRVMGKKARLTVYKNHRQYGVYLPGVDHWGRYNSQADAKIVAFKLLEENK